MLHQPESNYDDEKEQNYTMDTLGEKQTYTVKRWELGIVCDCIIAWVDECIYIP